MRNCQWLFGLLVGFIIVWCTAGPSRIDTVTAQDMAGGTCDTGCKETTPDCTTCSTPANSCKCNVTDYDSGKKDWLCKSTSTKQCNQGLCDWDTDSNPYVRNCKAQ